MTEHIKKLDELLQLGENQKIVRQNIKTLTAPGENYGSLMLSVDITIEGPEGTEELKTVAKTLPPNDQMQEMFQVQVTFRKEMVFYESIVPTLRDFQRKHDVKEVIDFVPKYYGSRYNLTGGTEIDADTVLILENLKVHNFINFERTEGFDLETSKLIIKDLAHLHAVPIALKLEQPDVFEKIVKQHLTPLDFNPKILEHFQQRLNKLVRSIDELAPFVDRLEKLSENAYPEPPPREPYATISHNDCWVNNTMVQVENGKPVKNKLVDFQSWDYGSPAKDLIFFLFSSVQNNVLEKHYDKLIAFYYKTFTSVLMKLHCDVQPFSYKAFLQELDIEGRSSQLAHTIFMLVPIFAPRGAVTDVAEFKPTDFGSAEPTELHKQKLLFVVKEFAKRNWI